VLTNLIKVTMFHSLDVGFEVADSIDLLEGLLIDFGAEENVITKSTWDDPRLLRTISNATIVSHT